MSFISKAIAAIGAFLGHLFGDLYKEAENTINNLPIEQQQMLQHGSGVIAILNAYLGKTPEIIKQKIIDTFPDLDFAKLELGLALLTKQLNLGTFNSFEETIGALQKYLSDKQGGPWAIASFSASSALAYFIAPAGTKVAVITNLLETAYQKFIKPLIIKPDATADSTN